MNKRFFIKKYTDKTNTKNIFTNKIPTWKSIIRYSVAFSLSAVMAFSLIGCSGKEDSNTKVSVSENENTKKANTSVEQASVSEYGYNTEYINLSEPLLSQPVLFGNSVFYINYTQNHTIELQSFDLSAPEQIKTYAVFSIDGDEHHDIVYLHPNENGSVTFLHRDYIFSQLSSGNSLELGDIPGDAAVTEEYLAKLNIDLEALGLNFSEISGLTMREFASLYENLTGSEEFLIDTWSTGTTCLETVDSDGNQISKLDISSHLKNVSPRKAVYDNDGNFYMYNQTLSSMDNHIIVSENFILKINMQTGEAEKTVIDYEISSLLTLPSGDVIAIADDTGTGKIYVKVWDKEKKNFSDWDTELPASEFLEAYPAYDDSFYYIDDRKENLYLYDLSEKKRELILNFSDWDISVDKMDLISYIDETHILVYGYSYGANEADDTSLIRLTRVKASEIVKKKQIVLANLYPTANTRTFVADFNKTNPEYRIIIKNYIALTDENASIEDGIIALTKDLLSGNAPDLIDLQGIDTTRYVGSGIFEDLYPFMNNDAEFKNRNLNKNILKLSEEDGALYALPSLYSITALASSKNLLGDEPFTLDKAAEIMAANSDKDIFDSMSRENLLATLFAYNETDFIDYKAKTCNFTNGMFEKILNLANALPSQEALDKQINSGEYVFAEQKVKEGNLLFYSINLNDLRTYQLAEFLFDGSLNITGYPSAEGNTLAIRSDGSMYAISSQSQYKNECWQFIKQVFDEETKNSDSMGMEFPVDNDAFEAYLARKAAPVMKTDDNGNEVEMPDIGSIGNIEYKFYAPTAEQVQAVRTLTDSVNVILPFYTEGDIYKILAEEAAPFFAGDKTAEEVCKVIQSRINILINEEN